MSIAVYWGADLVRIFPETDMGSDIIKAVARSFLPIPILMNGGIDYATSLIKHGVAVVEIDNALLGQQTIVDLDFSKIQDVRNASTN